MDMFSMWAAAVGNANDEHVHEFRQKSENKALFVYFLGTLMMIAGVVMAAARKRTEINAAGYATACAGAIATVGGMMRYSRS